jgi:PIN domain nuclease of toxin-antitoxin system
MAAANVGSAVIDASAVLAYINGEPGGDALEKYRDKPLISAINLAEVVSKLTDFGFPNSLIADSLGELGLVVVPFDEKLAYRAGELRKNGKKLGLSLADRACLALAERENLTALTGDKAWAQLSLPVSIALIR